MLENDRTWKQDYLYRMFSHHTKDKEKENYVVNAIWARLDDLNVKPVTQQYVRRPNGYALIDLYFPQINYGVECDEAYHKDNTLKDAAREIDLQTALSACSEDGLTIRRVDATLDADALHARIREIVCEIKQRSQKKENSSLHGLSKKRNGAVSKSAVFCGQRMPIPLKRLPTFAKNASARMRTIASSAAFSMWPMIGCFGVLSWRLNCLTAQRWRSLAAGSMSCPLTGM